MNKNMATICNFAIQNGREVLILLHLFPFLFHLGKQRDCNAEVVQSTAALNIVLVKKIM